MNILLAVSGGIDSMYMASRAPELFEDASFAVAHCNFGLRGSESDEDEAFVLSWCSSQGIPCYAKRFDTVGYAKANGISIEMAARDLRYEWFSTLAEEEGFDAVAVAHNANDNAETLILNLLRGTGTKGARGMSERYISHDSGIKVLRPLLYTSRAEIEAWAAANALPYREDSTNAENTYKRNKIRNQVFPLFGEINPSFLEALSSDMRHFAQVDDIADDYFESMAMSVMLPGENYAISIPQLKSIKHWEYVLFRLLTPYDFDEATLNRLIKLLEGPNPLSGKTFEASKWKIVSSSDALFILPREKQAVEEELSIPAPGEYIFNGRKIKIESLTPDPSFSLKQPSGVIIADASKLQFPFILRHWKSGDWMNPLGLRGRKKLSDMFVDLKWSLPQKEDAIVLCQDGDTSHVLALLCERIDESVKVGEKKGKILRISLMNS